MDLTSVRIVHDNERPKEKNVGKCQEGMPPAQPEQPQDLTVLCLNLKELPKSGQLLVCAGGVFLFFLIYGYFQVSQGPGLKVFL